MVSRDRVSPPLVFPRYVRDQQKDQGKKDKAAGVKRVRKKKKLVVEDHDDVCCGDLQSLGGTDESYLVDDDFCACSSDSHSEDSLQDLEYDSSDELPSWMLYNSSHCQLRLHSDIVLASTVEEAVYVLSRTGGSTRHIVEVMGGMGR